MRTAGATVGPKTKISVINAESDLSPDKRRTPKNTVHPGSGRDGSLGRRARGDPGDKKRTGVWDKTKGEIYEGPLLLMGGSPRLITSPPRPEHSKVRQK